jgi:hypothetical protein
MEEWTINTANGLIDVDLNFFIRTKIQSQKVTGYTIFLFTDKYNSFTMDIDSWCDVLSKLRDKKIESILKTLM